MGSPESEEGRREDENQVRVVLSKGFWMGKTQVTQAQWQAVMGNNPSYFAGASRPVECVSWHDTQEFLEKVNLLTDNTTGENMTLPTEAQWEYAARAGREGMYPSGRLDDVAWYTGKSREHTRPVRTKKANAWGLHDMSGNVWEWCQDWYEKKLSGGSDPSGPDWGLNRVVRGGGWISPACFCRVASRNNGNPTFQGNIIGFRVARSLVP